MRALRWLFVANVILAIALAAPPVAAQTGPEVRKNCCKTSTENTKFCCEDCCTGAQHFCPISGCAAAEQ